MNNYILPSKNFFEKCNTDYQLYADDNCGNQLIWALSSFGIQAKYISTYHTSNYIVHEIKLENGVRIKQVTDISVDLARVLKCEFVNVIAPIPGKSTIGLAIVREDYVPLCLGNLLEAYPEAVSNDKALFVIGTDLFENPIWGNLASYHHILISGRTGTGKTILLKTIISSLAVTATPNQVRLCIASPNSGEYNAFSSIPHLLLPIINTVERTESTIYWLNAEIDRRYRVFAESSVSNFDSYKTKYPDDNMPRIVMIIDGFSEFRGVGMDNAFYDSMTKIVELGSRVGIHLIISTQLPSARIISGIIKAGLTTRICFQVKSFTDSIVAIGQGGAEKLVAMGDLLLCTTAPRRIVQCQAAMVTEQDIDYLNQFFSNTEIDEYYAEVFSHIIDLESKKQFETSKRNLINEADELFEKAIRECVNEGYATIPLIQRRLNIGYARAGAILDEMEQRGFISGSNGTKTRKVLITRSEVDAIFGDNQVDYQVESPLYNDDNLDESFLDDKDNQDASLTYDDEDMVLEDEEYIGQRNSVNERRVRINRRIICMLLVAAILYFWAGSNINDEINKKRDYKQAEQQRDSGHYGEAERIFKLLADYKDSERQLKATYYAEGKVLLASKKYESAIRAFVKASDYDNAEYLLEKAYYEDGLAKQTNGDWEGAVSSFTKANGLDDAEEQCLKTYYLQGKEALKLEKWDNAVAAFNKAGNYKDAQTQIYATYYAEGLSKRNLQDWTGAIDAFINAGNYKDADLQVKETKYQYASLLYESGEYEGANNVFSTIAGYKNADHMLIIENKPEFDENQID